MFELTIPKEKVVALNLDKIHPLKQNECNEIVKAAIKNGHLNKIIVFGSAKTDDCNSESDLDLYFDFDVDAFVKIDYTVTNPLIKEFMDDVDNITFWTGSDYLYSQYKNGFNNYIKRDIFEDGVIIYEKN